MNIQDQTDTRQQNSPDGDLSFSELLDVLGFTDREYVSICHKENGSPLRATIRKASDGPVTVAALPAEADIYFGVNPVRRKIKGRGKNGDATRLSSLYLDLDFSEGKCGDIDTANAIIDDLSKILATPTSAITHSGGGLHPYWPVESEEPDPDLDDHINAPDLDEDTLDPASLLARWKRLVNAVAQSRGAKVDPVFDLARVLRVPETFNHKAATNGQGPIPVVCHRGSGVALSLLEIHQRFDDYGIHHIPDYADPDAKPGEFGYAKAISNPDEWTFADSTCNYMTETIRGWANDAKPEGGLEIGKGRHPWLLSQAIRLACVKRLGCVTETDFDHAKDVLVQTFKYLLANRKPFRDVGYREIEDIFEAGIAKAATKTENEARGELGNHKHDNDNDKTKEPIFREYGPTEWAKPVESTRFFIKQALCVDTWGVNGGPEKSLKTHDNIAIGMSIATGIDLYQSESFPVLRKGKALLIIGEGGEKQILRLLHRICRAYGIKPEDVAKDPAFPLVVEFGAAPLNSDRLRDEIHEILDRHQPDYVSMESFYNFHPAEVSAANLYERGQVIDSYHKLVREGGSDVCSMLTDHNKKGANELGLRHISMYGQAENSDSWIQRIHRRDPDVASGEFCLTTSFNSRNWGGSTYDVDWHLGPFDHDAGCHTGDICWDVCPHKGGANGADSAVKIDIAILVRDNPWKLNRQEIFEELRPVRKQDVYAAIKTMVDGGELNEESPKLHGHGGKAVVIGPGSKLAALIGKVVIHGGGRTP